MSGGQTKNRMLMQLLANVCKMPVVLPADESASVVLGAAMLGRFAAEAETKGDGMKKMSGQEQAGLLWEIMVRFSFFQVRVG